MMSWLKISHQDVFVMPKVGMLLLKLGICIGFHSKFINLIQFHHPFLSRLLPQNTVFELPNWHCAKTNLNREIPIGVLKTVLYAHSVPSTLSDQSSYRMNNLFQNSFDFFVEILACSLIWKNL